MIVSAQTRGCRLQLRRKSLKIAAPDGGTCAVPLAEVERVVLGPRVDITQACLATLVGAGVPVVLVSSSGRFLGSFEPPAPPRASSRALQYRADDAFKLEIARRLVAAKIANARRALQRLNNRRPAFEKPVLSQFKQLARRALEADSVPTLRGIEGSAAARYFLLWERFLPAEFPFERRSIRPPLNPVNAVLSFLSAVVYGEMLSACLQRGLDPAPGCLHDSNDGRHSLPLDLIEPFRPALVEPLVVRLFSLGILNAVHFKPHGCGVHLNDRGRVLVLEQLEDRMTRRFLCPQTGHKTDFRNLIRQAPLLFKAALGDASRFDPFRMP